MKIENQKSNQKPKNLRKARKPQNKIQILIDDVVVQKLISAMGFGAVNRGDLDTYFSGRYLVFQGGISEGENS